MVAHSARQYVNMHVWYRLTRIPPILNADHGRRRPMGVLYKLLHVTHAFPQIREFICEEL
jgi:hypothetical protein